MIRTILRPFLASGQACENGLRLWLEGMSISSHGTLGHTFTVPSEETMVRFVLDFERRRKKGGNFRTNQCDWFEAIMEVGYFQTDQRGLV
jgi:hypothetical protein